MLVFIIFIVLFFAVISIAPVLVDGAGADMFILLPD